MPDGEWVKHILQNRLEWISDDQLLPTGRIDRAVQVGIINVIPGSVRDVLLQYPQIADAAVRLMRAEEGSRLKAFIAIRNDLFDLSSLQVPIDDWAAKHLSTPEIPRALSFDRALPHDVQGMLADWVTTSSTGDSTAFRS